MPEWKKGKLGDFVELKRGYDLPTKDRKSGSFPVVSSSGVTGTHSEAKVEGPGVVTGRYGTLGEVFYIRSDFWPLNTALYVRDFKGNNPRFISYFLRTLGFENQNAAGAVPGVNRNHLHKLEVRIPNLRYQNHISTILSTYDDLLENNLRRIRIVEKMVKMLYQEWFVEYKYPQNGDDRMADSAMGEIPENWRVQKFTDIGDVLTGGTPSTKEEDYWEGDIPFFTPKDAHGGYFVHDTEKYTTDIGVKNSTTEIFPPKMIFITARGTVGNLAMPGCPMAMNQSCYALRSNEGFSQEFLFLLIQERIDYLQKNTGGATFDTIIIDTFRNMDVLVPPEDLVAKFTQLVKPMFDLLPVLGEKNRILRQKRDLLLPRLISGELDLSELDIDTDTE